VKTQLEELAERVIAWTAHDEIAQVIDDLVEQTNADLNLVLRTRFNTKTARLQLNTNGNETYLPSDFLAANHISLGGVDLKYATPEQMHEYEEDGICGYPVYSIIGDRIRIAPSQPVEYRTEFVPYCYSLSATTEDVTVENEGNEYAADKLTLFWTPDDNQDETIHGVLKAKRINRVSGEIVEFTIDPGEKPSYSLNITHVSSAMFIYDFVYMAGDTRSNLLRFDATAPERLAVYETGYEKTISSAPPLEIDYFHKFPMLETFIDDGITLTPRNALYDAYPNVYLYGTLQHAWDYLMEGDKSAYWGAKFTGAIQIIKGQDAEDTYSGSSLKIRVK